MVRCEMRDYGIFFVFISRGCGEGCGYDYSLPVRLMTCDVVSVEITRSSGAYTAR